MRSASPLALVLFLLSACGAPERDGTLTTVIASVSTGNGLDTATAYASAIAEYIKAMSASIDALPDTVYIGKHDEFPDIELPAMIGNTHIRVIIPTEAEVLKNGEHFVHLNIFGWLTPVEAEFFVVNFRQGMRHWPDGRDDRHLRFRIGGERRELELDSLWQ